MTKAQHTHETTCSMFNKDGSVLGEIDVRIEYVVLSQGMPPQPDDPGSPAEVDVVHIEMQNAPKSGRPAQWVDAWDWLWEWGGEWADKNANDLAAKARLTPEARKIQDYHGLECLSRQVR
jgi:hypothetical protein